MDNFNKTVFEKKYLRSLVSNFDYDYFLIMDFDRLVQGSKEINNKLSLNIYNSYLHLYDENEWNSETLKTIYKLFIPFDNKVALPTQDFFDALFDAFILDDTGYGTYNFLFKGDNYSLISSSILSLLINKKAIDKKETPIIIQPFHYKKLRKEDLSEDNFIKFISEIRKDNEKYYLKRTIYTNDQIYAKINTLDKDLLKFLKVIDIRIFGSYFNGIQNEYSDIDFLVVTNDKNCDLLLTSSLLGKSFTDLFGDHIDIHVLDPNKTLNRFDFMILLNSKSVKKFR